MEKQKTPLWKQVAGAVAGGTLGLALYTGYGWAEPMVKAYISIPQEAADGEVRIASSNVESEKQKRIAARAREIAEQYTAQPDRYVVEDPSVFEEPEMTDGDADIEEQEEILPASTPPHVDAADRQEAVVAHEGAPLLPSSGLGMFAALAVAAGAVAGLQKRGVIQRLLAKT